MNIASKYIYATEQSADKCSYTQNLFCVQKKNDSVISCYNMIFITMLKLVKDI